MKYFLSNESLMKAMAFHMVFLVVSHALFSSWCWVWKQLHGCLVWPLKYVLLEQAQNTIYHFPFMAIQRSHCNWNRKTYELVLSNIPISCVEISMKHKIALYLTNYIVLTWPFPSFLSSNLTKTFPFEKTKILERCLLPFLAESIPVCCKPL